MHKTRLNEIYKKALTAALYENQYLNEGKDILVEGIDEDDQSELAKQTKEAFTVLRKLENILPISWKKTHTHIKSLKKLLPSEMDIFKLDLSGSKKDIASNVARVVSAIEQIDNILSSIINLSKYSKRLQNITSDDVPLRSNTPGEDGPGLPKLRQYAKSKDSKIAIDDIKMIARKSYVLPQKSYAAVLKSRLLGDLPVWDLSSFMTDILDSTFDDLISLADKAKENEQQIASIVDDDKEAVTKFISRLAPMLEPLKHSANTSKLYKPPVQAQPAKRPSGRAQRIAAAAAKRQGVEKSKDSLPQSSTPKVNVLGDLVKYRDDENRDQGFLELPKFSELRRAVADMGRQPNKKSRTTFKNVMNSIIGQDVFESTEIKKTEQDIIVEKWQRLAGIENK